MEIVKCRVLIEDLSILFGAQTTQNVVFNVFNQLRWRPGKEPTQSPTKFVKVAANLPALSPSSPMHIYREREKNKKETRILWMPVALHLRARRQYSSSGRTMIHLSLDLASTQKQNKDKGGLSKQVLHTYTYNSLHPLREEDDTLARYIHSSTHLFLPHMFTLQLYDFNTSVCIPVRDPGGPQYTNR